MYSWPMIRRNSTLSTGKLVRNWLAAFAICVLALPHPTATAQGIEPEAIGALANGTTCCIVKLDLARLQLPPLEPLKQLQGPLDTLREAVSGQPIYVAIDLPSRPSLAFARFMTPKKGFNQGKFDAFCKQMNLSSEFNEPNERGQWTILSVRDAKSKNQPTSSIPESIVPLELDRWTAAAVAPDNFPLHIAILPPAYLRLAYQQLEPELPKQLGGGSSRVMVDGLQWLHFACDPQTLKSRLWIQSDNPPAASELARHLPKMLLAATELQSAERDTTRAMLVAMSGFFQPEVDGSQIVWKFEKAESTQQFLSLAKLMFQLTTRPLAGNQSSNNMKSLLLAMHNYHDVYRAFPPHAKARGKDGRSGLSWRVHLLPFLEQSELYDQFKLDESWDSPHNIKLLDRMPDVFAPSAMFGEATGVKPFHTLYAAPVGEKTIFGGDKPLGFQNITDGSSNTIAIVELAPEHAIAWTSPNDYDFDPNNPAAKLKSEDGTTRVARADGSVQTLRIDNPASVWNALFSVSGGEVTNEK